MTEGFDKFKKKSSVLPFQLCLSLYSGQMTWMESDPRFLSFVGAGYYLPVRGFVHKKITNNLR